MEKHKAVNEFSRSEYIALMTSLANYDSGKIITSIGELEQKMKEFDSRMEKIHKDTESSFNYYHDKTKNKGVTLLLLSLPGNAKAVILNKKMLETKLYYGEPQNYFAITDSRVPMNYRSSYERCNVELDQQSFYPDSAGDDFFVDEAPEKHHFPDNLFVISNDLYDELLNKTTKYVVFGKMKSNILISHPFCSSQFPFTIHYTDESGKEAEPIILENSDSSQMTIDPDTGNSRAVILSKDSVDARFAISVGQFDVHKSRSYVTLGDPDNSGAYVSSFYLMCDSKSTIFWSNRDEVNESLKNFPEMKKKINGMLDSISEALEKVYCFSVSIRNRSGFTVSYAKNAKFNAITLNNRQDLDYLYSEIAKCLTAGDYFKISCSEGTNIFYISKEALAKTTLVYEDINISPYHYDAATGSYVKTSETFCQEASIRHGAKVIYKTNVEEEKAQIVEAYKATLTEEKFNNMYALALLKTK